MKRKDAVEQFSQDGLTVYLYPDTDSQNPRTEWDNFGRMVCWHRNYMLGDDGVGNSGKRTNRGFAEPSDFQDWWKANGKGGVILPLYLYDHSGITMRTGPFDCPWDSGQVGYIYATAEMIRKEGFLHGSLNAVISLLQAEVSTYDEFLTGEVYGYVIEDADGEFVDSCWGFFGRKYAEQEAKERLADAVENAKEKHTAALTREADATGDVPIHTEVA